MNWYLEVLKKYTVFDGRAQRSEYWYFTLFNTIVIVVLELLDVAVGTYPVLTALYGLGVLLPSLGVAIRRLHDTDRSGWWILIALVPLVGWIVLLVFYVQDSTPAANSYGPNPKAVPVVL